MSEKNHNSFPAELLIRILIALCFTFIQQIAQNSRDAGLLTWISNRARETHARVKENHLRMGEKTETNA